jgi:hypothetical protein
MMTYDEFQQVMYVHDADSEKHIGIVLINPPCDQNSILDYFVEHAENIKTAFHVYRFNRVYMLLNKDIVLKDTLVEYEIVTDLPTALQESTGDTP